MRLIDEVAARERFCNNLAYMGTDVKRILATQPTINPEDCRPRGQWLPTNDDNKKRCSRCDVIHLIAQYPHGQINFCPNCGAKMDGKDGNINV